MKSQKKVEVLLYKHPLKNERETVELDWVNFRQIHKVLQLDMPLDYYIILDGDTIVTNYSSMPTSEKIYIRATLQGGEGGDLAAEGEKVMGWGQGGMVLGGFLFALSFIPGLQFLFIPAIVLAAGGGLTTAAGYWLYTVDLDKGSTGLATSSTRQAPSLKGGRNSMRANQKVPVLLGRHLVVPWYAGIPFANYPSIDILDVNTEVRNPSLVSGSKNQYLHMLMGNTYITADHHNNSVKIGDVPFSVYQQENPSFAQIDFQEDDLLPTFYPERIKQEDTNLAVKRGDSGQYASPIPYTRISATNTKRVELVITFPQGLYQAKDQAFQTQVVDLIVKWKFVNEADTEYRPIKLNGSSVGERSLVRVYGNTQETARYIIRKEFDNDTPLSTEYTPTRQYVFQISRNTYDDGDSSQIKSTTRTSSSVYLESIRSYTGTFDGVNSPDTWPILATDQARINIASLSVKATDALDGTIDDLNYEMTAHLPVYSGTGTGPDQWVYGPSRNPASAFLYVLINPEVNQNPILPSDFLDRIDYASLETWFNFCDDWDLECNAFIVNDITVEQLLKNIVSTGFASWNVIDNKYTIYIDTYNTQITQLFTPRNSFAFKGSKMFNDTPTGMKVSFINSFRNSTTPTSDPSEGGFVDEVRYVYADYTGRLTDDPQAEDIIHDMSVFGAVDPEQAWRIGRYMLACTRLRPEVYTFSVDIEHIMCTRWDRIRLQHDVPLFGITSGRILSAVESGGDTIGFSSDEIIQYAAGVNYGVQIRNSSGTVTTHTIQNLGIDSRTILFDTPLTGVGVLFEDDLFAFGEAGTETVDLIVLQIDTGEDLTATLTCAEYNEAVYTAWQEDSGSIPPYVSRVSNGGGGTGGINVNTLPSNQDDVNDSNTINVSNASKIDYRISAVSPVGYAITGQVGFYPNIYDRIDTIDSVIYVNYKDGNTIYTQFLSAGATVTKLNSVSSKHPKHYLDGTNILYINVEDDGGSLYLKDADTFSNGSNVYSGAFYDFAINPVDDHVFIYDDINIYELDETFTLVNTFALSVLDLAFTDMGNVFYIRRSDGFIYSNNTAFDAEVLFYNGDISIQLEYASEAASVYFLKSVDLFIYKKGVGETDTTVATSIPFGTASAGSFAVSDAGNIVYSNNQVGVFYYTSENNTLFDPTLEGESFLHSFTGDITLGSEVVLNVDVADLGILSVGDALVGVGIPNGAQIALLGNSYLTMTVGATETISDASLGATGSRIVLNANKVIVPGTIEARLLSASAINSKARDDNGDHISEFDLDAGTMVFRNQAGDKILDFDPIRVEDELRIDGNITAKSLICKDINGNVVLDFSNESAGIDISSSNVKVEVVEKVNGGIFPFMNYPSSANANGVHVLDGIGTTRVISVCENGLLLISTLDHGTLLIFPLPKFGTASYHRQVLTFAPTVLIYLGNGQMLYTDGVKLLYKSINDPAAWVGTTYLNSLLGSVTWTDQSKLLVTNSGIIYSKPFPDVDPDSYGTTLISGHNPCYVGNGQMIYLNSALNAFYLKSINDTLAGELILTIPTPSSTNIAKYIGNGTIIYSDITDTSYVKSLYGVPNPLDPGVPFIANPSVRHMTYLGGGKIVMAGVDPVVILRVQPNYI